MFLILFFFATLTSAISMLEIVVASVAKGNEKKRPSASLLIGILILQSVFHQRYHLGL